MPPKGTKEEFRDILRAYPDLLDQGSIANRAVEAVYDVLVDSGKPHGFYTALSATNQVRDIRPDLLGAGAPPKEQQPSRLSPADVKVKELAKRMGVKDPEGAKERFLKRQQTTPRTGPSLLDVLLPGDP